MIQLAWLSDLSYLIPDLLSSLCQHTQSPHGSHGSISHDSHRILSTHHPSSGPGPHLIIHQVITLVGGCGPPIPPISDLVDLEGGPPRLLIRGWH